MSENIKVHEKDKHIFDMLQAKKNFFAMILKLPLSEKEIKKIKRLQSDWGVLTTENGIDMIVYGAYGAER